ncbi:MAG TPA: class I SAM-dependent methyltransferase [Gemmatimonadaceae bacterium]|jgi:methyltransferase (TIGR00027 family)
MTERKASRTAQGVAFLRAVHQMIDSAPLILVDPVIVTLFGAAGQQRINDDSAALQTAGARGLRAHVVLRSRFAEDRLAAAVQRGVTQYVILGAGYDTFAYRQPDWARGIRVIEIDQPASQAAKREHLDAAGIEVPANVTFADVDFEHETLDDGLRRHGISMAAPTFFSWLGVTMYLTEDAVDAVLRTVAAFPSTSEIVFTFAQPREARRPDQPPSLAELAANVGEPWLSYFEPAYLDSKLRHSGFASVEFLTAVEAANRYFRDRADDLPPPRRTSIVSAIR